jgi:hypothetical protein
MQNGGIIKSDTVVPSLRTFSMLLMLMRGVRRRIIGNAYDGLLLYGFLSSFEKVFRHCGSRDIAHVFHPSPWWQPRRGPTVLVRDHCSTHILKLTGLTDELPDASKLFSTAIPSNPFSTSTYERPAFNHPLRNLDPGLDGMDDNDNVCTLAESQGVSDTGCPTLIVPGAPLSDHVKSDESLDTDDDLDERCSETSEMLD